MSKQGALIVFAREPRAGAVKTRLAADLGKAGAAQVYSGLLSRTLGLAERSSYAYRYLFAAEAADAAYFDRQLGARGWTVCRQCEGDIGRRMHDALKNVLERHAFAVLIGSDVADCTGSDLELARQTLARARTPAVIGPSADGGYWLIGLATARAEIFEDMVWSTGGVFAATRARMEALGIEAADLSPRHDVDELTDLRYLENPGYVE